MVIAECPHAINWKKYILPSQGHFEIPTSVTLDVSAMSWYQACYDDITGKLVKVTPVIIQLKNFNLTYILIEYSITLR